MRRSIRNLMQTVQRVAAGVRLQYWDSRELNRSMETTTLDPGNWQEIQDKTKQYDEIVRNRHMSPEEVNAMRLAFQQNPPHRNPGEYETVKPLSRERARSPFKRFDDKLDQKYAAWRRRQTHKIKQHAPEVRKANRIVRFYTAGAALAVFMVVAELVRRTKR